MKNHLPNTPWLSACDAMNAALDWLCDIERIRGQARDEALQQATAALDRAQTHLAQLADPRINLHGAERFRLTLDRALEIAAPIRAGLPSGTRFRRSELRDIAELAHPDRRRAELAAIAAAAPSRAGMSAARPGRLATLPASA